MPDNENTNLSEFEEELLKSFDEINEDIDKGSEELDTDLEDFDPEGFFKAVHEDDWEDEDEDEDFDLNEEEEEEEEPESGSKVKKGKGKKVKKAFTVKPDPRLDTIMKNQVRLGKLLKSIGNLTVSTSRQVGNLAEAKGHLPRDKQDAGVIGGQVDPTTETVPEAMTKAVEEVSFLGDSKMREAAIDQAFEKGLLPEGLDNMQASALYREDKDTFVKTVAPVLISMRRSDTGKQTE